MLTAAPLLISHISIIRVTPNTVLFNIVPPVYNNPEVRITSVVIVPSTDQSIRIEYKLS